MRIFRLPPLILPNRRAERDRHGVQPVVGIAVTDGRVFRCAARTAAQIPDVDERIDSVFES